MDPKTANRLRLIKSARASNQLSSSGNLARGDGKQINDPTEATSRSLMVRDLSGRIYFWNSAAEQKYGWSHQQALGNVSHNLLNTIFPEPLDVINDELVTRGMWKGELIDTKSDGSRVKVSSRWELYRDAQGRLCTVLEVNDNFTTLEPTTAHFDNKSSRIKQLLFLIWKRKIWWFAPMLIILATFFLLSLVTPTSPAFHIP